jgi:FkbM family methyltransferase
MFETDDVQVGKLTVSVIKDDRYIGGCLRLGNEWDGWMRQDLPHMVRPGTDILDIGANIGWNSLMYSDYGPVHSFEPIFHEIVSKNVSQNTLANPVTVHPYGLSSKNEEVSIFLQAHDPDGQCNYGGTSLHPHKDHVKEPTRVLVKKLDDVYTGIPSLMKIDVEGHEFEVIMGAIETINRHKPFLYVEIFGFEESPIPGFLERLGYKQVVQRPEHNYLFIPS